MAVARAFQGDGALVPGVAGVADIPALNAVFSEAFTDRYRRDGLSGVRVPYLHPGIWRYAIEDAGDGALVWRDAEGAIVAFNMVHCSGREGWMGPLAVRPDRQGSGIGKEVVSRGVQWLAARHVQTIGLETMPRTMDNIGFYSRLGFLPAHLTITLTLDAATGKAPYLMSAMTPRDRRDAMAACRALTAQVAPGADYTREIDITEQLEIGDTVVVWQGGEIAGFALCHTAPLVEGRSRDEMRILKLVLAHESLAEPMARSLAALAARSGSQRYAIRVQGAHPGLYARLVALGGRVRWTDLRMTLSGYPEPDVRDGVALSNWEI